MDIKSAKYLISNEKAAACPSHGKPEYAFIGRSNVGKSSLINMITRRKALAKTSQTPGKTLLINHFSINDGEWYIVDLPGYGYAARGKQMRDKINRIIEDYVLNRREMCCLFVLIDIRHDPQKIDMEFIDWLGEHDVPFALVFTKADKLGPVAAQRKVAAYLKEMKLHWSVLPPHFVTSSEKSTGRDELLGYIDAINKECQQAQQAQQAPCSDAPDSDSEN